MSRTRIETHHSIVVHSPDGGSTIYDFVVGELSFGWQCHESDSDGAYRRIGSVTLDDVCDSLAPLGPAAIAEELDRICVSLEAGQRSLLDRSERVNSEDPSLAHFLAMRAMHLRRARIATLERMVEITPAVVRTGLARQLGVDSAHPRHA
jgi:hypothetical protein